MRIGGIAALLLAAACGSPSTPYTSFVSRTHKLFCQHQVDCGFADPSYESLCEQLGTTAGLDESKINFDSGASQACFDAIKQLLSDCHYRLNLNNMMFLQACQSVLTGKSPAGSPCPFGIECAPGTSCSLHFSNSTCSSSCIALGMTGDSCNP